MSVRPSGIYNVNYKQDMAIYRTRVDWFWGITILLILLVLPLLTSESPIEALAERGLISVADIGIMTRVFTTIIAVTGLNILLGYTGQISLGHAAFLMVGAYTSQVLVDQAGIPFWVALPIAALFTGIVGLIFGIPSLRVKGFYLAMATLAAQFMIPWFIRHHNPTWFAGDEWIAIGWVVGALVGLVLGLNIAPMITSFYQSYLERQGLSKLGTLRRVQFVRWLTILSFILLLAFILSYAGNALGSIDLGGDTGKTVSAPTLYINTPDVPHLFPFLPEKIQEKFPTEINWTFTTELSMYYVCLISVLVFGGAARNIIRSRIGRALISVRDNDLAAEQLGINVFRYKLLAFFIAAIYAGIAGSLDAHSNRSISPTAFGLEKSIFYLGMLIIGGVGFPLGPSFGVIIFYLLRDKIIPELTPTLREQLPGLLTFVNPINIDSALLPIMFGTFLMVFLIFEPRGIAHRWAIIQASWKLRPFSQA